MVESMNKESTVPERHGESKWGRILASRRAVLSLLFLVMGVLAIPLLYWSPAFSAKEKWMFGLLASLHTGILAAIAFFSCAWAWSEIQKAYF